MSKTIVVCGFGPGISTAVAEKFGREGFSVALVARRKDKLDEGVKALEAKGIRAAGFQGDLGDPARAAGTIREIRATFGNITAIQWNAYSGQAGDLTTASPEAIRADFDIATTSLIAIVQAALPDLRTADGAAILVTNGGLGKIDPGVDAMCVQWGAMGLGLANAAKAKLVGLLSEKLKGDRVYVGEITVMGAVKGTAFDSGNATIDPAAVADKFWSLYTNRTDVRANFA